MSHTKFVMECKDCNREWDWFFFVGDRCSSCADHQLVFKGKVKFHSRIHELGGRIIGEYVNAQTGVKCECSNNHLCYPKPTDIQQGKAMCPDCSEMNPGVKKTFQERIKELGGEILGEYINGTTRVECRCPQGHICNPLPRYIQQGRKLCETCAYDDPDGPKQRFRNMIEKLGGEVIGEYVNVETRVECKCEKGHICNPVPAHVQQGRKMCTICHTEPQNKSKRWFYNKIKELGGEVLGKYISQKKRVKCRCPKGHICKTLPKRVQWGDKMCNKCNPEKVKHNFCDMIKELGGKVIGRYIDHASKIECICPKGHRCNPTPKSIQQGIKMCRICANNVPGTAEKTFRDRIGELGGKVVGEYVRSTDAVLCQCPEGHLNSVIPGNINQWAGMCRTCAGRDPIAAKQHFYDRIKELGGEVLGEYIDAHTPVECRCSEGHTSNPYPKHIQQGEGMCKTCTGKDPQVAKQKFHDRIKELGGEVLGDYINCHTGVECRCSQGHISYPVLNYIGQGGGMCGMCSGNDPRAAAQKFSDRIKELGGEVLGNYVGYYVGVKCRCSQGHISYPKPNYIGAGGGMCASCGLKSEPLCRNIFEEFLGMEFPKKRPEWLIQNGYRLELDGYNEDAKLAFEYQGRQHEKYIPHFHRDGPSEFQSQLDRDKFKIEQCKKQGVLLFVIPSKFNHMKPDKMKKFIFECLIDAGLNPKIDHSVTDK